MAALIKDRHDVDVETTPTQNTGEFAVWVDGARVVRKLLPFIRPRDSKVLGAVEAALGGPEPSHP